MAGRVLFIYRLKGASCHKSTIIDNLRGFSEVRTTKDKFGRVFHKTYSYPGIPHHSLAPGIILVEKKSVLQIENLFTRCNVPHAQARVNLIKFRNWDGFNEKR